MRALRESLGPVRLVGGSPSRDRRRRRPLGACVPVRYRRARRRGRLAVGRPWLLLVVLASSIVTALLGLLGAVAALFAGLAVRRSSRLATVEPPTPEQAPTTSVTPPQRAAPTAAVRGEDETPSGWSSLGEQRWDYLPPLSLGNAALARAIDYLARNHGGRHGRATARAWATVESASLPLAVFLREVDDRSGWRALQRERERLPVPAVRPVFGSDRDLGREKLAKIVALVPVWEQRGRTLLAELEEALLPVPALRPSHPGSSDAAAEAKPADPDAPDILRAR